MKGKLRGYCLVVAIIALIGVSLIGCTNNTQGNPVAQEAPKQFINIASGGTTGTYFPIGGGFAEIWNKNIPGVSATVQSTAASIANINLLREGKVEAAICQNDAAYYANNGLLEIDKYDSIRGIATLYSEPYQFITLDKNIKSVADLKGKKISMGNIGSLARENNRSIFELEGIDIEKDVQSYYLSFAEAGGNLKDGVIDAFSDFVGLPVAAIQDVATQHQIYFIPVDGELRDKLIEKYPFYTKYTIPANTYKGQTEPVETIAVRSILVVDERMSEDLVYNMTKSIFENLDRVAASHAAGVNIKAETALNGMSVPLHSGAQKYFDEIK